MRKLDRKILVYVGIAFLIYAFLGNYVALPGYIRFLERGGASSTGNSLDMAVVIGATKTILWMYSFQLGVLLLAIAHTIKLQLHTKAFVWLGLLWLTLWSWPHLPAPGAWFYIILGSLLLVLVAGLFMKMKPIHQDRVQKSMFIGALVFFAFATWEVCGLGTAGRMLHPEQATTLSHGILVTQSSKLMLEFVLAWALLFASRVKVRDQG